MSASREKKKRQDSVTTTSSLDPKAIREAERKAADKKSDRMYATIAIVFVVVTAFLLVYNSSFLQRGRTALTIEDTKYTTADMSFFYKNAYQNYMSNGYGSYFIDPTLPLSAQTYLGDENMTWEDYFKEEAINTAKLTYAACAAAEAEGMTLTDEDYAELEKNVASVKEQAASNGYSYKGYLRAFYGAVMTPEIYEENMKATLLATNYATAHKDSISFTDEEVQAYYEENKNNYDLVDGAYILVPGTPEVKKDDEGNTIEATAEEKVTALSNAQDLAESILADYKNGKDLKTLAEENKVVLTSNTAMTYTSGVAMDWLFDADRTAGDAETVFDEANSAYYVAVFNGRERDNTLDYNVRHILVTAENLELPEGETADTDMIAAKAQEILDSWDGTEAGFAALAEQHTKDTGSASNGGLYENVVKGQMVTDFNDWCYAEGRKAGDTGIVKSTYGQHIMYFVGYGSNEYWHSTCTQDMTNEAYNQWQEDLIADITAETHKAMNLIG